MQFLDIPVATVDATLHELTAKEARELDRSLGQRSRRKTMFMFDALSAARARESIPPYQISFLEYLLQEWNAHSSAIKLAMVARFVQLAGQRMWPGETTGDRVVIRCVEKVLSAAIMPSDNGLSWPLPPAAQGGVRNSQDMQETVASASRPGPDRRSTIQGRGHFA